MAATKKKKTKGARRPPAKRTAVTKKRAVKRKAGRPPKPAPITRRRSADDAGKTFDVTLGTAGRLVVPTALRTALNVDEGDVLRLRMRDGRMVVSSAASDVEYVQDLLARSGSSITIKKTKRGR